MNQCLDCPTLLPPGQRRCVECFRLRLLPTYRPETVAQIEARLAHVTAMRRWRERVTGQHPLSGNGWEQRPGAAGGRLLAGKPLR